MLDLIASYPALVNFMSTAGNDFYRRLSRDMFLNVGVKYKGSSRFWDRVELQQVTSLKGKDEPHCPQNEHLDLDIVDRFNSAAPAADKYLLHCAPGWQSNQHRVPALLVPGAGLDANSFTDLYAMGYEGLQQQLLELGYRVFAVTFSHTHGDNFIQAEQLAAAITRIRELTGTEQVDLLAYSKGGTAARIYLSGLSETPYRGDVRRYLMLGTPNMGIDFPFRNSLCNYLIYISGSNGVLAWDKVFSLGSMVDVSRRSIYRDGSFPGQCQLLYRWDDVYKLDMLQQDWWSTYYGGSGLLSHSRGIDQAIADGGGLVERLDAVGLQPEIDFYVLAGNNNSFNIFPGDESGPGDGLVFLESVLYTDGLARRGAALKAKDTLPINHLEFLYSRQVARWVNRQLEE
ncbi:esterase/lipase family protein [Syntrophomonas curvata]